MGRQVRISSMNKRRWLAVLLVVVAGFALAHPPLSRLWRAGRLLSELAAPPRDAAPLVETDVWIPSEGRPIRARIYQRAGARRGPGLVVAHGVHYRGIDERRLVPFARALARAGRTVLTPELDDLTSYRITARGERVIRDSVRWLSSRRDLIGDERVGLLGFSFAGGLSLVAASRPELQNELAFVTSVGGYHDLPRVLRFLVSDRIETPKGSLALKAHDYGLAVVVHDNLEHFVEPADRQVIAEALELWLHEDRTAAVARASERTTLSGERLFRLLESGKLSELAPELLRLVDQRKRELAELSPAGRLGDVRAPVYLLHGSADSVIPPSETEWAEQELGGAPHQALVSPLLEHVEVDKSGRLSQELALVDLMAKML